MNGQCRHGGWVRTAMVVLACGLGACAADPATEVVVHIDSDIGAELTAVQVVIDRGPGTTQLLSRTFPIAATTPGVDAGTFTLPGTIAVVPNGDGDHNLVRAQVTAVTSDPTHAFTTTVSTMFVAQRTLELDVFLAARCENPATRMCPVGQTCGVTGCVPSLEPPMDFNPDASLLRDVSLGDAVSIDAADITVPTDVPSQVDALDAVDVVDVVDVPQDVPPNPLPPPHQIAPMSTSTVTVSRPTLHWAATGASSTTVEIGVCPQRDCATVAQTFMSTSGSSASVPTALTPGVWFWRIRSTGCGSIACAWSPVWQFTVGRGTTATHDTSFGSTPDLNGDGNADLIVGAPQQIGGAHGTMVGAVFGYLGPALTTSVTVLRPAAAMSSFGMTVASVGDVNGDGYGDFVFGASGMALLYFGPVSPTTAAAIEWDGAGSPIAGVGDVDGDGYADVVIGSLLYRGGVSPAAVGTPITGPTGVTGFGSNVTGAGDVNGDGLGDLLIAASSSSTVYLYQGTTTGLSATPGAVLHGSGSSSTFGAGLAGAGDVNGDGLADVAVGEPNASPMPRVNVYLGTASGYLMSASPVALNDLSGQPSSQFGTALAMGGDVDGNGYDDVLIGNSSVQRSGTLVGSATVANFTAGAHTSSTGLLPSAANTVAYGASVTLLDFDGDGYADAAAGDPQIATSGASAYAFRGASGGISAGPFIRVMAPAGSNNDFGRALAWMNPWGTRRGGRGWRIASR